MTRSPTPSAVIDAFRRYGLAASVFIVAAVITLGSYHEAVDEEMDATRDRFQSQAEERIAHLRHLRPVPGDAGGGSLSPAVEKTYLQASASHSGVVS